MGSRGKRGDSVVEASSFVLSKSPAGVSHILYFVIAERQVNVATPLAGNL